MKIGFNQYFIFPGFQIMIYSIYCNNFVSSNNRCIEELQNSRVMEIISEKFVFAEQKYIVGASYTGYSLNNRMDVSE